MGWTKRGCLWEDRDDEHVLHGYFDDDRVNAEFVEGEGFCVTTAGGTDIWFKPGRKDGQWFHHDIMADKKIWIFDNRDRKARNNSPDFNISEPSDDEPRRRGRDSSGWAPRPEAAASRVKKLPWYAVVLGLTDWPCSADELKSAYRAKAKTTHPDAGGTNQAFQELQEAMVCAEDALHIGFTDDEVPF